MVKNQISHITQSLIEQELQDIFIEFIKIKEEKYEKSPDEFIRRSAIIRFVTIIEQICRIVIEKQIKEKKYKKNRDETIIVKLQDLENINDINLGFLISASYNFQNIKNIINTLKDYEINIHFEKENKDKLEKLFYTRHDIIHTIKSHIGYKDNYKLTHDLMKEILDESTYGKGYFEYLTGLAYYKINNKKEQQGYYEVVSKIEPDTASEYRTKGLMYLQRKCYKLSIELFDKALLKKSNYSEAWYGKAEALKNSGKFDESIDCYNNALKYLDKTTKIRPNKGDIYLGKANCLLQQGKYSESIFYYDELMYLKHKLGVTYCHKGVALLELNKMSEAITYFEKSIKFKDDYAHACYELAKISLEKKDNDKAFDYYKKIPESNNYRKKLTDDGKFSNLVSNRIK